MNMEDCFGHIMETREEWECYIDYLLWQPEKDSVYYAGPIVTTNQFMVVNGDRFNKPWTGFSVH